MSNERRGKRTYVVRFWLSVTESEEASSLREAIGAVLYRFVEGGIPLDDYVDDNYDVCKMIKDIEVEVIDVNDRRKRLSKKYVWKIFLEECSKI